MSETLILEEFRRTATRGERLDWIREHLGEEAFEKSLEIRRRRQFWRRLLLCWCRWWRSL